MFSSVGGTDFSLRDHLGPTTKTSAKNGVGRRHVDLDGESVDVVSLIPPPDGRVVRLHQ